MNPTQPTAVEHRAQVTPAAIMHLGMAFWGSKTLLSAVELGVFSELASAGALEGEALRERLDLHPRGATDFFDALVALGMLTRENGRYTNTPATQLFLDQAKPSYIGAILEVWNSCFYDAWGSLTEGLRTGRPQIRAKDGEDFFEVLYTDPVRTTQFARAMSAISPDIATAITAKFPWQNHHSVTDIGCAEGAILVQIALTHKHLTGSGFDLPAIKPDFDTYTASFGLDQRLNFTAGDFFTDPLPPADVLIMGHILHSWDTDTKRLLLKKAYDTLPENGTLIVYDSIIDDERRHNTFSLLSSLNMLILTRGGTEYTSADCRTWMQETGFRESYTKHLTGPTSIIIGIK